MPSLQVSSGLERGMVRSSRANLVLRNVLSRRPAWLDDLFAHPSLSGIGMIPGGGVVAFKLRLIVAGRAGPLLQIALPDALLESLGLPEGMRPSLRDALVAHQASALMPALREFFEDDVELRIEAALQGWPETDHWSKFQLLIPKLNQRLPGRMVDAFALKLSRLLAGHLRLRSARDVPLQLFAGTRLELPVSAVLRLSEGDVLLCKESRAGAGQVGLYAMSASAQREGRHLATVRREDGRVEHLSPGPWLDAAFARGAGAPLVRLDVVEARLVVSAARCRSLTLGQCLAEWPRVTWLPELEVRLGGRRVASARRTFVAGSAGFEILELHRPDDVRHERSR